MKKAFIFFIFLSLGISINFLPIQKNVLPYIGNVDAGTYIDMSHDIENSYIYDVSFFGFFLGALNWFSLPFLLNAIDIENGYWRMMIINALILYGIIDQLSKLAKDSIVSEAIFIGICLLFMPFLWCWIFIPSKENFTVLGLLILFNIYRTGQSSKLSMFIACLCGIFKTQILASIVSTKVLKNAGRYYFWISLLIVNFVTILVHYFFEKSLSVQAYLNTAPEEIHSANIILFIEKVINIPLFGIFGVLARLVLYFPAGISNVKNFFGSFEFFLMSFSSVVTALLSMLFLFFIRRRNSEELKVFWSFLIVYLFIPFIQFRYFWWTIPIFLYFILGKSVGKRIEELEM